MLLGPIIYLPLGLVVLTAVGCVIEIIASDICWRKMEHLPEDEQPWSEGNHFVIDEG